MELLRMRNQLECAIKIAKEQSFAITVLIERQATLMLDI